ncbi:DUF2285 domain-containing protein [Novosphingobium sp. P6W]|nr:DUF2285 domain-containing protein [Novosphingobium sp. P6W]
MGRSDRVRYSRRANGGCTFAENPGEDCTQVVPVWSAALDPCVLRARIAPEQSDRPCRFDARARGARRVEDADGEHIAFDCRGDIARIDLFEGRLPARPVLLSFEIVADERLSRQMAALRRVYLQHAPGYHAKRLRRQHLALLAADARAAGASLREIAERFLGPGDWPGDGEHRKSLARRLVATGSLLCRAGPAAVLESWPGEAG